MSIKNIPQSLLDAVKGVVVNERAKYFEEEQAREKLVAEKMLSPKQKKIAAMAGDKSKIDAADFVAMRSGKAMKEGILDQVRSRMDSSSATGQRTANKSPNFDGKTGKPLHATSHLEAQRAKMRVSLSDRMKKEDVDQDELIDEASDMPEKPFKYNKKTGTFDRVKKMEEEVEPIEELSKGTLGSYVRKAARQAVGAANAAGREEMDTGKNSSDKRSLANRRMGGILRATRKMEEDIEHIDEKAKWRSSSAAEANPKHQADVASFDRSATAGAMRSKADTPAPAGSISTRKPTKVATSGPRAGMVTKKAMDSLKNKIKMNLANEERDTPGNGRVHQCAIHVKSEQFGEGKTLTTQHADPDEYGNIDWYDVMFEHGIERVMTEDIQILVSEAHTHSKKKGMM